MNRPAASPEMPQNEDNAPHPSKRRNHGAGGDDWCATSSPAVTLDTLPAIVLSQISSFAEEASLSGSCRTTLDAIRELHYKIHIADSAKGFSEEDDPLGVMSRGHMGLNSSGGLATGRVVARITVAGCTDLKNTKGGYQILEKAVKRVVRHSIPTLRSITVKGRRGKDSGRVAAIIGELVPVSIKRHRVAPKLTRVELHHGANGIAKAGKAIVAGLWPALEELIVPHCHANLDHMQQLIFGLSLGYAPNLRSLNWDDQSCGKGGMDDAVLSAIRAGKCPHMERLSFTDNFFCSEYRLGQLRGALQACSRLRELRMDCSRTPGDQLRDLTAALLAGDVPRLTSLYVRKPRSFHGLESPHSEDVDALRQAAMSRVPAVYCRIEMAMPA